MKHKSLEPIAKPLEKLVFDGLMGHRWGRDDRLMIVALEEETSAVITFAGRQFVDFCNEMPLPLRDGHKPLVRLQSFVNRLEPGYWKKCEGRYLGSFRGTRYRRHYVELFIPIFPEAAKDSMKTGYIELAPDPDQRRMQMSSSDRPHVEAIIARMAEQRKLQTG